MENEQTVTLLKLQYDTGHRDGLNLGILYAKKQQEYSTLFQKSIFQDRLSKKDKVKMKEVQEWINQFEQEYL